MTDDAFKDREKTLEDSFFFERDTQLMRNLKDQLAHESQRDELCRFCGIKDKSVVDGMVEAGIRPDTIPALALAPLVMVAWADGLMETKERDAVMKAAHNEGIEEGSVCYQLLEGWLKEKPPESLKGAWIGYVRSVVRNMEPAAANAFKRELVGRAKSVAKAAGGVLGVGAVSTPEKSLLDELETAFPS